MMRLDELKALSATATKCSLRCADFNVKRQTFSATVLPDPIWVTATQPVFSSNYTPPHSERVMAVIAGDSS